MIIHNFDPVLIDLGFFQIKWYSIAYIMGIILGWAYALKIIKKLQNNTGNFEPIKRSDFDDLLVYLVIGIILGGRLGYVIFYNLEYYIQNYFEIFKLWQGGMSFQFNGRVFENSWRINCSALLSGSRSICLNFLLLG